MQAFNYHRPGSLMEACRLLAQYGPAARVMAGGTDLVVALREENRRLAGVSEIIDLGYLGGMNYIREEGDTISIGALTTHTDIAASPLLQKYAPLLAMAAAQVGSPQIRNRGTMGGNLANASPAADTVPAFIALEARVNLVSSQGERQVPVQDLLAGPYRTTLAAGEIITAITFKKLPPSAGSAFLKLGRRKALSIARLNIAVVIDRDAAGRVTAARIVPGAALPVASRVPPAEALLLGNMVSPELARQAGEMVGQEMVRLSGVRWSTEYKLPVIAVLTRRAILQAAGVREDE
ncbi:Nicotinate dehydrogenase FAD-subunit [Neomoorella glycerini]|uniref:Nicotinate dehydrogenase FAD-subunit n=1 Tax=Neomoorella glycerini TaxID=55779 RepID=A0A6I5ZMW3_9FIRM|nr:xanthine dehydrogenase family protein subunit M [Moorella glycerini]QGP91210.1 Nicotinate dehydrogenase FAD-subunit [Moorella glycerini]